MARPSSLKIVGKNMEWPNHKWFKQNREPKKDRFWNKKYKYEHFNGGLNYMLDCCLMFNNKGSRAIKTPRWRRIYRLKEEEQRQECLKIAKQQGKEKDGRA